MSDKVRHQLFLSAALTERLDALAAKPGASKSSILADAIEGWLDRRGTSDLENRFGQRLNRISMALGRVERDGHVLIESLALFVRYELSIHAPLAENDAAGRAKGRERFQAFVQQVGQQLAAGKPSFGDGPREGGR